jgi:hypothetical protein
VSANICASLSGRAFKRGRALAGGPVAQLHAPRSAVTARAQVPSGSLTGTSRHLQDILLVQAVALSQQRGRLRRANTRQPMRGCTDLQRDPVQQAPSR